MESQTPTSERRKSLTRIFGRVKSAIRSGRTSTSGPSGAEPATRTAPTTAPATTSESKPEAAAPAEAPFREPGIIEADDTLLDDRTATLLAKYNLDYMYEPPKRNLEPQERVQRAIKMRVRYTCHRCNTSFGHDKECNSCQHRRCTKCSRYPPKKAKNPVEATKKETQGAPETAATHGNQCTCHMCQTAFQSEAEECPNCHHKVCDQCVKETQIEVTQAAPEATSPAVDVPQETVQTTSETPAT